MHGLQIDPDTMRYLILVVVPHCPESPEVCQHSCSINLHQVLPIEYQITIMKTGDDSWIECIADALGAIPGIEWLPVAFGIRNPWGNIPNGWYRSGYSHPVMLSVGDCTIHT